MFLALEWSRKAKSSELEKLTTAIVASISTLNQWEWLWRFVPILRAWRWQWQSHILSRASKFPYATNFVPYKILRYERKGDPEKHLNKYKTQISLRGASPALEYRAFHLTLIGVVETWYEKLLSLSIQSYLYLKIVFLNQYLSKTDGKILIQGLQDMK